jgi:uncharacterized protein DUF3108
MRFLAGVPVLLLTTGWLLAAQSSVERASAAPGPPDAPIAGSPAPAERFTYDIEWRLVHAGTVAIESHPSSARMKLESAGLVSALFKINDTYSVNYEEPYCAASSLMDAQEGKRHRETTVTYDRAQNRATFLERDLVKNAVIRTAQVDIPNCVHDVVGGLLHLRTLNLEPGQSAQAPVSDGRRSAMVKVEAQEREELATPAGKFKAIRHEANLLNGVVYPRKGRIFVWISDDARRIPVQIRLRIPFPVGTVTLQLRKEEML